MRRMTDSQSLSVSRRKPGGRNRRRELVVAARKLFVERGYRETSVSAIVQEAGVAQGTFYLYFKKKPDVLVNLRGEVLKDYIACFTEGMGGSRPADERLVEGIRQIYAAVDKHRDLLRIFREASTSDELARLWIEGREMLGQPLSKVIEEGAADGSFQVDRPRMSALLSLALFDDLLFEALEYQHPAPGPITLAHATRYLLRALGVPGDRLDQLVQAKETHP